MRATDIMTRDPQFVTPDDSVSRAAQLMRDADVGMIPVVDGASNRWLPGVITDRDIATVTSVSSTRRIVACRTTCLRATRRSDPRPRSIR